MRVLFLFVSLVVSIFAKELHWEENISKALKQASMEGKVVMVMVESSSCRWCQKMKIETLGDSNISDRLQEFVLVKVDRESLKRDDILYAKYLPTIYFMTPQKRIIERVVGFFGVLDFNSWIDDVQKSRE
jgi:thiol:disulfide interchange protein